MTMDDELPRKPRAVAVSEAQVWGAEIEAALEGAKGNGAMNIPSHVLQDELFLQATSFPPAPGFYQGRSPDEIDERLRHVLHLASLAVSTMTYVRDHIAAADAAKAEAYEAIAADARRDYLKGLARDVNALIAQGLVWTQDNTRRVRG